MYSKKRKSKNMETISEVLTIAQVVTLIREAGGSAQTLYSMAEDFGVLGHVLLIGQPSLIM